MALPFDVTRGLTVGQYWARMNDRHIAKYAAVSMVQVEAALNPNSFENQRRASRSWPVRTLDDMGPGEIYELEKKYGARIRQLRGT